MLRKQKKKKDKIKQKQIKTKTNHSHGHLFEVKDGKDVQDNYAGLWFPLSTTVAIAVSACF